MSPGVIPVEMGVSMPSSGSRVARPKSITFMWLVFGEHYVRRLQVAVDHSPAVCRLERLGNLFGDVQGVGQADSAPAQPPLQRLATYELHRNTGTAVQRGDLINGTDERMVEARGGARLAQKLFEHVVAR